MRGSSPRMTQSSSLRAKRSNPEIAKQELDCFVAALLAMTGRILGRRLMQSTPFDLTGRVAVVTGSSRGFGRSSAELLAKLGAKVVISSRKADACEAAASGIRKA